MLRADEPTYTPSRACKGLCGEIVKMNQVIWWRYALPPEPTVIVLSHMPGKVAMRTCFSLSYTMQSYWTEIESSKHMISKFTCHFIRYNENIVFLGDSCNPL